MLKKTFLITIFLCSSVDGLELARMINKEQANEAVRGFCAGVLSAYFVDAARSSLLPDMTRFKLYDNYGVCRDQLAGQAKVAIAYTAATLHAQENNAQWLARMIGVLVGTHCAVIAKKVVIR